MPRKPTGRPAGRPSTGQIPTHNVRVPDELWATSLTTAASEGRNVSGVIRDFLAWYTRQPGATAPTRP